ncbi:hypothetical protein ABPG72_010340 [Tetrahymena utriculariae]
MNCAYRFTSTHIENYSSGNFNYDFIYKIDTNSKRENYCIFFQDLLCKAGDEQEVVKSENYEHNDFIAGIIFSESFKFESKTIKDQIIEQLKNNIYTLIGQPVEGFVNLNSLIFQKYYSLENYANERKDEYPYYNQKQNKEKQIKMINLLYCKKGNIYVSQPFKGQQNIWIVKLKNSNEYKQIQYVDLIQISEECYKFDINYHDIEEIILSDKNNQQCELIKKREIGVSYEVEWLYKLKIPRLYYLKLKK